MAARLRNKKKYNNFRIIYAYGDTFARENMNISFSFIFFYFF